MQSTSLPKISSEKVYVLRNSDKQLARHRYSPTDVIFYDIHFLSVSPLSLSRLFLLRPRASYKNQDLVLYFLSFSFLFAFSLSPVARRSTETVLQPGKKSLENSPVNENQCHQAPPQTHPTVCNGKCKRQQRKIHSIDLILRARAYKCVRA